LRLLALQQKQKKAWLVEYMHPTHRKLRDGWGTRAFVAGGGEQATTTADPPPSAKDDNQRAIDDN
jgi:hypothetical protein